MEYVKQDPHPLHVDRARLKISSFFQMTNPESETEVNFTSLGRQVLGGKIANCQLVMLIVC